MNLNQETLIEIVDQGILEAKNKIYTQRQNDKKKEKESGGLSWSLVSSITNNPHLNLFFFFLKKFYGQSVYPAPLTSSVTRKKKKG